MTDPGKETSGPGIDGRIQPFTVLTDPRQAQVVVPNERGDFSRLIQIKMGR